MRNSGEIQAPSCLAGAEQKACLVVSEGKERPDRVRGCEPYGEKMLKIKEA